MKKVEIIIAMLAKVNAKENKKNDIWEVPANKFETFKAMVAEDARFKICNNKRNPSLFAVYDATGKTRYIVFDVVKAAPKHVDTNGQKTKKVSKSEVYKEALVEEGRIISKEKGNAYVVYFMTANMDDEEISNKDMTTCAEIKAFIKMLRKDKIEMLKIFKVGPDDSLIPTRLSAWVIKK